MPIPPGLVNVSVHTLRVQSTIAHDVSEVGVLVASHFQFSQPSKDLVNSSHLFSREVGGLLASHLVERRSGDGERKRLAQPDLGFRV